MEYRFSPVFSQVSGSFCTERMSRNNILALPVTVPVPSAYSSAIADAQSIVKNRNCVEPIPPHSPTIGSASAAAAGAMQKHARSRTVTM